MPALKSLTRAIFATTKLLGARDGAVIIAAPNEPTRAKCQQQLPDVNAALVKVLGAVVPVTLVVDGSAAIDDGAAPPRRDDAPPPPPPDDEVDISDLVDVPPETVVTPTDRLLQAFPGSQMIDE
jgi:DNA polymerase-3 subunit gamma/tau